MEKTYHYMTSANGYSAIVYDDMLRRTKMFFPHIYKNLDEKTEVKNLMFDTYFGISYYGKGFWLPEREEDYEVLEYLFKTGIIHTGRTFDKIRTDEYIFSPMTFNGSGMFMLLKITALSDIDEISLFSLHNFHMGIEDGNVTSNNEQILYDKSDVFFEKSLDSDYIIGYKPLVKDTTHSANPINPYTIVKSGGRLTNVDDTGIIDDAVCGFEKDYSLLRAGDERWFGIFILYDYKKNKDDMILILQNFIGDKTPEDILNEEIQFWDRYFSSLDQNALKLFNNNPLMYNAAVFLKMAQVREKNSQLIKPNGQIVASLPPGMWNITWIRDMTYSIFALIELGLRDEAISGLRFILEADAGYYKDYVGTDYGFSICRYYGNGKEESDFNEDGPNIEFDGAGLFLISVAKYIKKYGIGDIKDYLEEIFTRFADVLIYLIDSEGLIRADSSIWEHHLNGKERHFTYTQITALKGLAAAEFIAKKAGNMMKAEEYRLAYENLRKNIFEKLVHKNHFFVSSLEEYRSYAGYLDASVVDAINFGIIDPDDIISKNTLEIMKNLKTTGGGYKRNDDGDWYDRQEWVFIDLRIADAMKRTGDIEGGESLINRVRLYIEANNYQFSELINEDGSGLAGAIPMIGFGAGSYILANISSDFSFINTQSPDASYDNSDVEDTYVELEDADKLDSTVRDVYIGDAGKEIIDGDPFSEPLSSCSCNLIE